MFACAEHAASSARSQCSKVDFPLLLQLMKNPRLHGKRREGRGGEGRVGWELNNLSREKGIEVEFGP